MLHLISKTQTFVRFYVSPHPPLPTERLLCPTQRHSYYSAFHSVCWWVFCLIIIAKLIENKWCPWKRLDTPSVGKERLHCVSLLGVSKDQQLLTTTTKPFSKHFAKCHLEFLVPSTCRLCSLSISPQLRFYYCSVCLVEAGKPTTPECVCIYALHTR